MPQATSRHPVYWPSDAPDHWSTKKQTQQTKAVSTTTTSRPLSSSQPHGRPSSSNATSHKSQYTKPVRDEVGSTASDSKRIYYQQQGGNRGRKSRTKSGTYHHGSKQRHQQDS